MNKRAKSDQSIGGGHRTDGEHESLLDGTTAGPLNLHELLREGVHELSSIEKQLLGRTDQLANELRLQRDHAVLAECIQQPTHC